MDRVDFSTATKRLIADRAGHRCSLPTCGRTTIGPGAADNSTSGKGVASHIYSAAPGGPRGQGGLTENELSQPENGIWLCSDHARIIDNNCGMAYSPETLLSYKMLHEARIQQEVQGLYSPTGWIHSVEILDNPVFAKGQAVHFAKLNLLYGENMTGKTALTEWIGGAFDNSLLSRWRKSNSSPVSFRLSYLNPKLTTIDIKIRGNDPISHHVNGQKMPFAALPLRVFRLTALRFREEEDDLSKLSNSLGVSDDVVHSLAEEVEVFQYAKVHNIRFVAEDGKTVMHADVDGTVPGLPLCAMSGRETERIFIEFITAAARASGRHCPTLLILDGCPSILFDGIFDFYSHHWLDPSNQFQTIMCIPTRTLDLDALRWQGWEVMRTDGKRPEVRLTQQLRIMKK